MCLFRVSFCFGDIMEHLMISFCFMFLSFLVLLKLNIASADIHRTKRFLSFPPRSFAVAQIIAGIGIPVDLELEAVTMGVVFKSSFFLPLNTTDFTEHLGDPFNVLTHPIDTFFTKNKRSAHVNDNTVDGIVDDGIESSLDETNEFAYNKNPDDVQETDLATMRWTAYKGLEIWAESHGLPGRPCVLRTICESAHTTFDYSNGVFGELLHVLLSPSTTNDKISEHSDHEYLHAEMLGKDGAPCERVFNECKVSILQQFGGIYAPMINIDSNKFIP